jgi:uncharacterized protein with FMN-binding domain
MSTRPSRRHHARTAAVVIALAPPMILSLGACRRSSHGTPGGGSPGGGVTFPTGGGGGGGGTGGWTPPPTTAMPGMDHGDDPAGGAGDGTAPPARPSGTFTGSAERHTFGPVQVQVTVSDGRVTAVKAVQRPTGGYSDTVNNGALPKLEKQAIDANSAAIAGVSGATLTSSAYRKSLQNALAQAGL